MSYGKRNEAVEQYFAHEFPYLLAKDKRRLGLNNTEFAEYLAISLESLENYLNGASVPRSDTLIKILSKCSIEFLADIFATTGLHDKYAIVSRASERETGISIIEKRNAK